MTEDNDEIESTGTGDRSNRSISKHHSGSTGTGTRSKGVLQVVTQGLNEAACKAYEHFGFVVDSVQVSVCMYVWVYVCVCRHIEINVQVSVLHDHILRALPKKT